MDFARTYLILIVLSFLFGSCAPQVTVVHKTVTHNDEIDAGTSIDSSVVAYIAPFKHELNAEMEEKLVYNKQSMTHEGRNSQIGFWICDILLERGQQLFPKKEIDGAFYNPGGIRLEYIDTGWITKRNIYELVPFDNYLVLLEMTGKEVKQLCDHMADREGWPVSKGWTYTIFDEKSRFIELNGEELQADRTYQLLTNDYIANGGDQSDFLIPLPQASSGKFIRDVMIDYLQALDEPVDYAPRRRVELMMR